MRRFILLLHFFAIITPVAPAYAAASHALVLFGEPKYQAGFAHFAYVNPEAPKGGLVKLYYSAAFDSLNPFILKGNAAPGLTEYVFDSLMTGALDEPQSYYGLIADSVDLVADKSKVTFHINPKARWHDGTLITPDDVVFSYETLIKDGHPSYRLQYAGFSSVEKTGEDNVTFHIKDTANRELPYLAATMPIISKAYYLAHSFKDTSLAPPLGSGPYKVAKVDVGRSITFERVKDYWAKDLPARKGQYNFDTLRIDVYRDETVALEAFKSHNYDFREEYIARNWATAYDIPAVRDGRIILDTSPHKIPRGMQAYLFNLRKTKFADRRVREAIALTMDFEWMNKTLFFDAYTRNDSLFQNTDFAAVGLPGKGEVALMEPYRAQLPETSFGGTCHPPKTDGSGAYRPMLLQAQQLLDEAGWVLKDGRRVNEKTGEVLTVEFLSQQKTFERVVAAMQRNLKRLGIEATLRYIDDAQYVKRVSEQKDFDIINIWWNTGVLFPGSEQRLYWHSSQAFKEGGTNLSGMQNPAVDRLIEHIETATDLPMLRDASRALDRIILCDHVLIPHWSLTHFRTAYWNQFGLPETRPLYGRGFDTWWVKE